MVSFRNLLILLGCLLAFAANSNELQGQHGTTRGEPVPVDVSLTDQPTAFYTRPADRFDQATATMSGGVVAPPRPANQPSFYGNGYSYLSDANQQFAEPTSYPDFEQFNQPCACRDLSRTTLFEWSKSEPRSTNGNIATDRPNFTDSDLTVGKGVNQIELGYTFSSDRNAGTETRMHSFPELLVRRGIVDDWLEFRIGWNYFSQRSPVNESGSDDLYLGFKAKLTDQDGIRPSTAIIPQMRIPIGADAFSAGEVRPGLNFIYSWQLAESWSLAGSTQANRSVEGGNASYTEIAQSMSAGYSVNDRTTMFVETYALFPHSAVSAGPQYFVDGGFTILVSSDRQLDIRIGHGLNDNSADFFAGTGLSFRF